MNRLLIVPLVLAAFLLAACSGAAPETAGSGNVQEITLVARDLEFEPNTIEVTAGQRVNLTLHNQGVLEHDFSVMHISAADVDEHSHGAADHAAHMDSMGDPELHVFAGGGETSTLTFTALEAGTYEFYCAVAGHKEAGMTGTLIVHTP
jgi:uncharacterized cupredoxin-like copper-binding protein